MAGACLSVVPPIRRIDKIAAISTTPDSSKPLINSPAGCPKAGTSHASRKTPLAMAQARIKYQISGARHSMRLMRRFTSERRCPDIVSLWHLCSRQKTA